ncbi:MAG: hypothetical protein C0413_01865 [Clostridiales bacterium]|nr:hypothetical protein [Clostridiales bacterium]
MFAIISFDYHIIIKGVKTMKILLVEPGYNNKYPPLGLMKISYFHKFIKGDLVRFVKGELPIDVLANEWDRIYITTLFTFEWAETIKAINAAQSLIQDNARIIVGGIAATLMPEKIFSETGIRPVCGLLNTPGKIGIAGDEIIEDLIPDYDMLNDISAQYVYPYSDAYFMSATKGCGMKCGFCAVQTLEPDYIQYINLRERIKLIKERFGEKRDLLLMDNNVLRSRAFDQIIDDIIASGFQRGATYINPKSGKTVRRYVDFNQGLDANLLIRYPEKARRLSEIALRPARIAFDHIEDKEQYERAIRLCAEYGINDLSNYILYNCDAFSGKGKKYLADRPRDLYERMRFTFDLKNELNAGRRNEDRVRAFSFPMRYIPLSDTERGYIGEEWTAKQLRAVQCMLIPTQGKGVGNESFFTTDFGTDAEEFEKNLLMPERYIAARGTFSTGGRGRKNETEVQAKARREQWLINQDLIAEWHRLFVLLGSEQEEFIANISDNKFTSKKFLALASSLQAKLYLHYLSIPRILMLLGEIGKGTDQESTLREYFNNEFPLLYKTLLRYLVSAPVQNGEYVKNFATFFKDKGVVDLLGLMFAQNIMNTAIVKQWAKANQKSKFIDLDLNCISQIFELCQQDESQPNASTSNIFSAIKQKDNELLKTILSSMQDSAIEF